ncbi:alpha-amylase family glycosyl hydrolase [Paraliobacillus sediminis]|uniref:alpha-amylase family glycosyl hydrolase n=1 Tax=Paraliobacillus sediminis TaxID=1885916 RepID=UPI000E3EAC5A|nr:alpha-amylase family glycosyl hydrolase [Paraliobacillus sediminis]
MIKPKNKRCLAISIIFIMLLSLLPNLSAIPVLTAQELELEAISDNHLRVHFESGDLNVDDLRLWIYEDVATWSEELDVWPNGMEFPDGQMTDYGPYVDIELAEDPELVEMIVLYEGEQLLDSTTRIEMISEEMNEVWVSEGGEVSLHEPVELEDNHIRVHWNNEDGAYEPWGLWLWGDVLEPSGEWPIDAQPFSDDQVGKYGAYTDVEYIEDAGQLRFLFAKRDDSGEQFGDFTYSDLADHDQIFINGQDNTIYTNPYYVAAEEEVEYKDGEYNISVSGEVSSSLNYNENAVLTVEFENNDEVGIYEIFADVSALGGPSKLPIYTETNEVTISVRHDIEPGEKAVPLTVVDEEFGTYIGSTTVQVDPRPDKNDDFDWDEAMIYFMLTDRFYDGDSSNNDPYGIGYENYENERGTYQGGDFKGITQNLDYLDNLGINTIWVTPIVENIGHDLGSVDAGEASPGAFFGYHGYWAENFEELNPHLGTLEDFHELIDSAAERNMKIMVDVVLNHPGYGLKADDEIPEEERPVGYPTDADRDRFDGMIREESGSTDLNMELSYLPDFLTEDPEVSKQLIDWQTSWIERSTTPKGNKIDYFRVDTVKHVDDYTWQQFKNELTLLKPDFKMIGESWGAGHNNNHGYLNTGTMDSLLDFEFKASARDFAQGDLESVNQDLEERNAIINNTATLGQFLGSHDEDGFLYHELDGNEGMLKIAAALQITAKGQPVIYYGEELGQSGANNWPVYDNRYDLAWNDVEGNDILEHYQKLLAFRGDNSEIFARGVRSQIAGSDEEQFLVFDRTYNGENVYVGLNVSEEEREVTLEVDPGVTVMDSYSGKTYEANGTELVVSIPAMVDGGTVLLAMASGDESPDENNDTDSSEGEPDLSGGEPDSSEGEPDSSEGEPDLSGGEPDSSEGEPDSSEGEPDSSEGEPDSSEGETDSAEEETESEIDNDQQLPETATDTYKILLFGIMLLLIGAVTFVVVRRKIN